MAPGSVADVLKVSTVNINGVRAAAKKGLVEWLRATEADVVCLQEVRATPEEWPGEVLADSGWHQVTAPSTAAKGRAGVAVLSRTEPTSFKVGFESAEFDTAGRYVEVDLPGVTVASLYLPSGEVGTARQDEKERFCKEFYAHLVNLRTRVETEGREAIVCGDWNIAHAEIDLKNWKTNQKQAGFTPKERAWLSSVFDEVGYVDVFRGLHPTGPGPYTWWTYRGRAFDNDAGWRIDYQIATPGLAATATFATVERAVEHAARWSDHAPVTVHYDV